MSLDAAGLFDPSGPLARVLPAFEPRPQQARMAQEVADSLASGRHLLIEAGAGIGKSMAYLLPAVVWLKSRASLPQEDRRVVVSTHTKALQEQLARKDTPLVQRALETLGVTLRYALLMGSENYLCVQRLEELRLGPADLHEDRFSGIVEALARHSGTAGSGLRSEIPFEVPDALWARVRRDRDICLGANGPFWEDCLYRKALARAREADLLIVNHALFFLDLKTGGRILPPHAAVILDEAHRVEESVVSQLGFSVSNRSVERLLDDLGGPAGTRRTGRGRRGGVGGIFMDLVTRLRETCAEFFEEVRQQALTSQDAAARGGRPSDSPPALVRLRRPGAFEDRLRAPLRELESSLQARAGEAEPAESRVLSSLGVRAQDLRERLTAILEQRLDASVYWVESGRRSSGASLHTAPIEVAHVLRRRLFEAGPTVVLTSATLSAAGSFAHVRQRLGVVSASEVVLGSPYDFERQSLLYLPASMPDPVAEPEEFGRAVLASCLQLLRASEGGAFVLFTSYALLGRVYEALQGDASLRSLELFRHEPGQASSVLEQFRMTRRGVLLGTMTFWQGVDVPGDALRLVILTRLPFEVPGHPIFEARAEAIRSRGGDPFTEDALPEAILTFRQGFGRLIRSREDRGVVAVLDPRIRTRPYGASFLESLPPCPRTESLQDAERFLRALS